jgi:hypothetical protein
MTIKDSKMDAFAFTIYLPDECSSKFRIFHDLAELFGLEFNEQAAKKLKKLLKEGPNDPGAKLSMDREADYVSLRASKADVIGLIARLINENSLPAYKRDFTDEDYERINLALASWKRPKPKPWAVGDVFAFKLQDGSLGYGQVIDSQHGAPSCALFERKTKDELAGHEVLGSRVVSILHIGSDLLDKDVWKVLGNHPPVAKSAESQHGPRNQVGAKSFGGGGIVEDLANAYFGLVPWNGDYYREDYLNGLLMPGIQMPETCWTLNPEERRAYRLDRGLPVS